MKWSKKTKIIVNSIAITALVGGGTTAATLGGLILKDARNNAEKQRKDNHNVQLNIPNGTTMTSFDSSVKESKEPKKLLKSRINLVSFGDSIGAGFTLYDIQDHRGEKNGEDITGMSYGSYMAKALQKANMLESYKNYSIGGIASKNLLELLDPEIELSPDDKKKKEKAIGVFIKEEKLKEWTKKSQENKKSKIQQAVAKADIITITIGANDLLDSIKLAGISVSEIMKVLDGDTTPLKKLDLSKLADADPKKVEEIINNIEINLQELMNIIEILNPEAEIVIVGYPMPLLQERQLLKELIKDKETGISKLELILSLLSSTGKHISENRPNVSFIDVDYEQIWSKDSRALANTLYDIHPTSLGYRFMAGIILDKLSHKIGNVIIEHPNKNNTLSFFDIYQKDKNGKYIGKEIHSKIDRSNIKEDKDINKYNDETPRTFKQIIEKNKELDIAIKDLYDFSYIDASKVKIKLNESKTPIIPFGKEAKEHLNNKGHSFPKKTSNDKANNNSSESLSFGTLITNLLTGDSSNGKKLELMPIMKMLFKVSELLERTEPKWKTLSNLIMLMEEKLVSNVEVSSTPLNSSASSTSNNKNDSTTSPKNGTGNILMIFGSEVSNNKPEFLNKLLNESKFKELIANLLDDLEKELNGSQAENIKLGLNYFMKLLADLLPSLLKIDVIQNLLGDNLSLILPPLENAIRKDGLLNKELKRVDPSNPFANHPKIAEFLANENNILLKFLSKVKVIDKDQKKQIDLKSFKSDKTNLISILDKTKKGIKGWDENGYKILEDFK